MKFEYHNPTKLIFGAGSLHGWATSQRRTDSGRCS